jgi:hypothetical protein
MNRSPSICRFYMWQYRFAGGLEYEFES